MSLQHTESEATELLWVATKIHLRGWHHMIEFILLSLRISAIARRTPGLRTFLLRGNPMTREFWTLSVWERREAMASFVRSEPHLTAMRRTPMLADRASNVEWSAPAAPPSWAEADRRMAEPTHQFEYRQPASAA